MGFKFNRKRQRPDDKWEPTKSDLRTAERIVFQHEQAQLLLQRDLKFERQKQLENEEKGSEARMWRSAVDPSTNKVYYYHRKTRERSFTKPEEIKRYEQNLKEFRGEAERSRQDWILQSDNETANTVLTLDIQASASGDTVEETEGEKVEVVDLASLSVQDFSANCRANFSECLAEVYNMDYTVDRSLLSKTLSIPLPQDVFHLVQTQLGLLDEYLERCELVRTKQGDELVVEIVLAILRNISCKQTRYKDRFLQDSLESCVAAANSFLWMVDKIDELMQDVQKRYPHMRWNIRDAMTWMVCQEANGLVAQFGKDAVSAASQDAVLFIMEDIHDSGIPDILFGRQWEEDLVRNEVAISITRIFERYISRVSTWFEQDFLYHKMLGALIRATICFYIETFVGKAEKFRKTSRLYGKKTARKKISFNSPSKAVVRIGHDVQILRDYYQDIASGNMALTRVVSKEFSILTLLMECMNHAANESKEEILEGFVFAVHKETGFKADITRYLMSDIWLLMGRKGEHLAVEECVNRMHAALQVFTSEDLKNVSSSKETTCFRLDKVLKTFYKDRSRWEQSIVSLAEGAIKKKRREIKRELKNGFKVMKYFLEDLEDQLPGRAITAAEF